MIVVVNLKHTYHTRQRQTPTTAVQHETKKRLYGTEKKRQKRIRERTRFLKKKNYKLKKKKKKKRTDERHFISENENKKKRRSFLKRKYGKFSSKFQILSFPLIIRFHRVHTYIHTYGICPSTHPSTRHPAKLAMIIHFTRKCSRGKKKKKKNIYI